MDDFREEAIAASCVSSDPIRCPRCKGQTLVLKGNVIRAFEERLQDGNVVEQKFAEALERETSVIDCIPCKISWQVMTEAESELTAKNLVLEESVLMQSHHYVKSVSSLVH